MRSKFLVSAAIASLGVFGAFASLAHAAGARAAVAKSKDKDTKDAKAAKPLELHADDKSIKKQTQWEDKVMGPDSTRKELEKIARARALNEKATQDKEKQAALEPAAPATAKAAPTPAKKNEVSLIAPEKNEPARAHDISPQLETAAAQKPVPAAKPADDKFIDKLLHDEDAPSKKRASSANDKELENLLAGAKEKPAGRKKGGDSVDDLIKNADKGPAMPAPRAQSGGLPEWAKQPEIAPTPAPPPPAPVAAKVASKPSSNASSGVIQVVQGAAGNAPAIVTPSKSTAPVASNKTTTGRKGAAKAAAAPVAWSDPFADKRPVASASPKKEAASRASASTDSSWNDPFAPEATESRKTARHTTTSAPAAPSAPASTPGVKKTNEPAARPAGWKDPFTKATVEPPRAQVAMRDLGKNESSKWEIATHRSASRAAAAPHAATARATASDAHAAGGWGVLKKRAR
jgi:hypothetical protein